MRPIYLDYNSTTPVDPRVLKAMEPYFTERYGNASSSSHAYGWEAAEAVEMARETIASAIGAEDKNSIIFTSGATESNNLVIKGIAKKTKNKVHVVTQKTEHKCILESCARIEAEGHEVTSLDVDEFGLVDLKALEKAIRPETVLCSIMYANNEIGTIQPIPEIAAICRKKGILLHSDAVQAVGKIPVNVKTDGIDLMSLSTHKMYGPKGIGALYVTTNAFYKLAPLFEGGGHERGLRSGTLNVPGIVGFGEAVKLCMEEMPAEQKRLAQLRDDFIAKIQKALDHAVLNGHPTQRLPNNVNLSFMGVRSDDLLSKLPQLALSTGSACSSGEPEPSYVMQAITSDQARIDSAIRIGLGRWTQKEDLDTALTQIKLAVEKLRSVHTTLDTAYKRIKSKDGIRHQDFWKEGKKQK